MTRQLSQCPVCTGSLNVTELACGRCGTRIQSRFEPCRFCRLAPDHISFVETFLRCEGNLSRVEKELGISYPTVRNRLALALNALGLAEETGASGAPETAAAGFAFAWSASDRKESPSAPEPPRPPEPPPPPVAPDREETARRRSKVLDELARGLLSADEAAQALRDLS